jgi:signal transduction histidine kinase
LGILTLILSWTWTLGRRVRKQTAIIGRQLQREAVQGERARIARDMHDEIGGKLARLSIIGEMAAEETMKSAPILARIRDLTRGVREAAGELEQIIWSIDPCHDTLDGVAHRVFQFAEEYFSDTAIDCRFSEFPELPQLAVPPEIRADIIAAFRESIANVLKHSGASKVVIAIGMFDRDFEIRISDNGCGFDPSAAQANLGNGLKNMKLRMEKMGGTLSLDSALGCGTNLIFSWNPSQTPYQSC